MRKLSKEQKDSLAIKTSNELTGIAKKYGVIDKYDLVRQLKTIHCFAVKARYIIGGNSNTQVKTTLVLARDRLN